jgi:glycine/D-amino acid oxidase-like deaminating enzyme
MSTRKGYPNWGEPPWQIDFAAPQVPVPQSADVAIIGAGFTGLAAAAWIREISRDNSVVVFEAAHIGAGASGRTGGMALAETAAGDIRGLGDVLAGLRRILRKLDIDCELSLPGAWEIGRSEGIRNSPIDWNDSGRLRVVKRVPGGTLDPGKLVSGLARAAHERKAVIFENHPVTNIDWKGSFANDGAVVETRGARCTAGRILLATNALSLDLTSLAGRAEAKLTLAIATEPLSKAQLEAIGLAGGNPFYTVDLPYLWGRLRTDGSVIFGAGLVDANESDDLTQIDVATGKARELFTSIERRIRGLHPALAQTQFTHRWGGPILFQKNWRPVFMRHPRSKNAIVLGAYAGHGVALSTYLGAWAGEVLLGRRKLPRWGPLAR